ncbi:MAG: hypothetical protein WCT77_04120 [Bacteroidota bacterium]|jgi:hypothetical protein
MKTKIIYGLLAIMVLVNIGLMLTDWVTVCRSILMFAIDFVLVFGLAYFDEKNKDVLTLKNRK